ncbi:response regulator [Altererythrobacter sp. MTPC7]|uniref:response regulator n=1 Tax=Altererythrobacter sp. MTPC7 TaxID=3056567 RepID=UPI0036F29940
MEKPTILVAEDERIIGFDLCETVAEAGYEVDGPFEAVSSAMLAYQKNKPDLAILDVQLGDGVVFPLAEKMMAEDVPVIFHSGHYSGDDVSRRFPRSRTLSKPTAPAQILSEVKQALSR